MEQTVSYQNPAEISVERKERVFLGILGALLFSLAGTATYFLLYQVGYIASLSGLVAVAASNLGYGLFSGNKLSKKGLVIAVIFAVLAMLLAEYLCLVKEIYEVLGKELGSLGYEPTIGDALVGAYQRLCGNGVIDLTQQGGRLGIVWGDYGDVKEVWTEVGKEMGMALVFCIIGAFAFVRSNLAKIKASKTEAQKDVPQNPAEF